MNLVQQLGIELWIIDWCTKINITLNRHTDKTSSTTGIRKWHHLVGGTNKRCKATMLRIGLSVWWAILQIGSRNQVLHFEPRPLPYPFRPIWADYQDIHSSDRRALYHPKLEKNQKKG